MSEHEHEYKLDVQGGYYYCESCDDEWSIQELLKERIENQARIKALEGAIAKAEEDSPWPEEVWIMSEDDYVEATPDDRVRTAISGFLMRRGWEQAVAYIRFQLEEV